MHQIYLFHILFTGLLFLLLSGLAVVFAGSFFPRLNTLILLAIGQFLLFISTPFKQIANGKEQFRVLLLMSIGANVIKVSGLLILAWSGRISLLSFIAIYIIASAAELFVCVYLGKKNLHLRLGIVLNWPAYRALIKESLPQLGVIICNAGTARVDWILLGIISTSSILAEYSFAYKAFEMSTLPLLIVAPLLLPKIANWFHQTGREYLEQKKAYLFVLAKFEIIFASLGILILNIAWAPVIDWITDNKYGAKNTNTILILSCCVPFLYVNNILWSVNFAQRRMKMILSIFAITFLVTCAGDLALIPFFKAEGAAIAYLAAIVIQTVQFIIRTRIDKVYRILYYLALCMGSAFISGLLAKSVSDRIWLQLLMASGLYVLLISASRQIRIKDWFAVRRIAWG